MLFSIPMSILTRFSEKICILEFLVFPIFYESISIPKNEFSKTIQSLWNIFMFCLA